MRTSAFVFGILFCLAARAEAQQAYPDNRAITFPGVPVGPESQTGPAGIIPPPPGNDGNAPPPANTNPLLPQFAPARPASLPRPPITDPGQGVTLNSVAATSPATGGAIAAATSFLDMDSGLTDCGIPFDQLREKSPSCKTQAAPGRICEQYSPSQFPEVVALTIHRLDGRVICSGTVIAPNWVLTAAHCMLGDASIMDEVGEEADLVLLPPSADSVTARATNAVTLTASARMRSVSRAIVYRKYGGRMSTPPYRDDLALLELADPFPATALQPALLASPNSFSEAATLAGYGISNADGGTVERFNLTWPVPLKRVGQQFAFKPGGNANEKRGFCQGDSGGPVFAGRYRGCKRTDYAPEPRPRLLQGVISFDRPGSSSGMGSETQRGAETCMNAENMVMQNITVTERREWICATTSKQAQGC